MQLKELILRLKGALESAKSNEIAQVEYVTDFVRDASYDVTPKQAAFMLRAACVEVDRAARAHDFHRASEEAMAAIARVEEIGYTLEPHAA